jgi:hypothetical protein
VVTLIFKVSATYKALELGFVSSDVFFKYRSSHINVVFITGVTVRVGWRSMTTEENVKNFPMCYWAVLQQSLVGHTRHSLESFYELRSLRCTVLKVQAANYVFPIYFALSIIEKYVLY